MAVDTFDPNIAEDSIWHGAPIRCYEFHRTSVGEEVFYRYCTSDDDIQVANNPDDPEEEWTFDTYTAIAISDEGITQSGEATASDLNVTMPVFNDFVDMFRAGGLLPTESVFLTIRTVEYGLHADETPRISRPWVIWVGTVSGIAQLDEVKVRIACSTLAASFKRGGLRLGWERTCPHFLYDSQCRVDPEAFKMTATVINVNGVTVQAVEFTAKPDGYFDGGYIQWQLTNGLTERRVIRNSTGNAIALIGGSITNIEIGQTVYVFPGCHRNITECNNKFNNVTNYGGFPLTPGKSPFDGNPVF